ncbi:TonB-dependent receptor [Hyphobacterium sp. CCMP332]|nr:TonB-dependent receptor [Hyphobacterium sp. CCMP332]
MGKKLLLVCSIIVYSGMLFSQSLSVSGTVTTENGETLPGVNVIVQDTNMGTVTDINGNYTIELAMPNATLIFSFIGFKNQVIPVEGRTKINVTLIEDIGQLDEVVVIGYGSLKKSDMTGSVTSVKSREIVKAPAADPVQSLQGKVAGLQILNSSGAPGEDSYVRLRGINTLNDNRVLYIVDGVIIEGGINFLNSQDIESIEVLKDASAKAIFGTRGANGVIIVTTKKGKGDAKINLSSEYSVEKVANRIALMNGPQFATLLNEANPGTFNNIDALPNIDWQDQIFEDWAPLQNHTVSISGGSEKMNYYFSGGYFGQTGVIPKSEFDRYTLKSNTAYQVKKYLKIGSSLTGVFTERQNPPNVVNTAYRAWPIDDPYNPDGTFGEVRGAGNPLAAIEYTNNESKIFRMIGNVYTEFNFLKDFKFKTSYQFDLGNSKSRSFTPVYFVSPTQQVEENILTINFNEDRSWIFENTLSYSREFKEKHQVDVVLGYSAQENNSEFISGTRLNLLGEAEELWYLNAGSADDQRNSNGAATRAINSILFRANYVYDSRYLFTATVRRDGSSSFGENNRYGSFPAFALGWNASNEDFFPDIPLNFLKFRASWGINGNQAIPYLDQYSRIESNIDGVFGTDETLNSGATFSGQPGNSDLKWEETTEYDLGVELGVFKSRLTATIDYYNRYTRDILVLLDLPGYVGAGAFVQKRFNAADVRNSGLEFTLNWEDNIRDWNYGLGFNGSTIKNVVEDLGQGIPGAQEEIFSGNLGNGQRVTRTTVGEPIGYFYGYNIVGVFQNQDQLNSTPSLSQQGVGDFIYEDVNGDGEITPDDRTIIGTWIPDFVYGFNANVGYKGINLSFDFVGQIGNQIYDGKEANRFSTLNFEEKYLDRWTGEGTSNTDPQASLSGINFQPSNYFVEDASFLKLRTVTLSYEIPKNILEKIKIQSASIYFRGTNLWIKTDYSGYSPEIISRNPDNTISNSAIGGIIDFGSYPTTKVWSAGLKLNF